MREYRTRIVTILGTVWVVCVMLWSAVQFYLMTAVAGAHVGLPPSVGVPVFTSTALTVVTSVSTALFHRHVNVKSLAAAARTTAVVVSVPSVAIIALAFSFADGSSGLVVPALFLGAGAISAWAVALALAVVASIGARAAIPAACVINVLPLLIVWLRVAT